MISNNVSVRSNNVGFRANPNGIIEKGAKKSAEVVTTAVKSSDLPASTLKALAGIGIGTGVAVGTLGMVNNNDEREVTIIDEGFYDNGKKEYEVLSDNTKREWNKKGQIIYEKLSNGTSRTWYENGQMKWEYLDNGQVTEWYEDGQIKYKNSPDGTKYYKGLNEINSKETLSEKFYSMDKYIRRSEKRQNDGVSITDTYDSYKEQDRIISRIITNPNGTSSEFKYDNSGEAIQLINRDANGKISRTVDFENHEDGSYDAHVTTADGEDYVIKFDKDGNEIEQKE